MSKKLPTKCPDCGGKVGENHELVMCMDQRGCGLVYQKEKDEKREVGWYGKDGKKYRPFKQYHTNDLYYDNDKEVFRFSANLKAQQSNLFQFDVDNTDIKERLVRASVIGKKDKAECEPANFWIEFDDYDDGKDFIDRLNSYLRGRHTALQSLRMQMREVP